MIYLIKTHCLIESDDVEIHKLYLQVLDQLRAMIAGSPLEDARHLAQRYSRMRQEAEAQVISVTYLSNQCEETKFCIWLFMYSQPEFIFCSL